MCVIVKHPTLGFTEADFIVKQFLFHMYFPFFFLIPNPHPCGLPVSAFPVCIRIPGRFPLCHCEVFVLLRESFTHLICPRHPRCGRQSRYWEVHQRQVANLLHRNLTSAGYSAGCAFRLQKYHYPSPRSSPSTECNSVSSEVSLNRSLRCQGRSWRAFRTWLNRSSQFRAGNVLMK